MPKDVVMPKMGYDMTEGTIVSWRVKEGDTVNKGDILGEIETGKVNIEIEAFDGGVVAQLVAEPGQTLAVGETIAILAEPGEKVEKAGAAKKEAAAEAPKAQEAAPKEKAERADGQAPAPATPVEASVQAESAGSAPAKLATGPSAAAEPTGEARRELREPSDGAPAGDGGAPVGGLRASPIARRIADDHGIDLRQVKGTGPGGRIVKLDVEDFLAAQKEAPAPKPAEEPMAAPAAAPAARPAAAPAPAAAGETIPLTRMRQIIGQRLQESYQTSPHFFVTVAIDMTAALGYREEINQALADEGVKVSVNDLVVKAVANALRRHPEINASLTDEGILRHAEINLGIAVALDEGLLVPVLKNAGQKSISQIAQEVRGLVERARTNKFKPDDLSGNTFTISNLGPFGVEHFTAVINPPASAILAVGAAAPEPVVRDGEIVVRNIMRVTMSSDHRVIDGAMAARFLQTLKAQLETPKRIVL